MCDPMDCSPPGPSVHGIHQARILEWVAMYSSRVSSRPRDRTRVSYISCTGRWVLYHERHLESPFIYYSASKYLVSSFFLKYTSLLLLFYLYYFPVIKKYLNSLVTLWASFEVLFWILCQAILGSPLIWAGYKRFTVFLWWDFVSWILLDVLFSCRFLHI